MIRSQVAEWQSYFVISIECSMVLLKPSNPSTRRKSHEWNIL